MTNLIGDKKVFAIEFEIHEFKSGFNSNSLIWLNNNPIGNFTEVGYFSAILYALNRIIRNPEELWLSELDNLNCKDIFYTIIPCYNNPDSFFDLSREEQNRLIKFDKFLFEWGDGFADWNLRVVVNKGKCKFIWVHTPLRDDDSYEVRNNIKCFDVDLIVVKNIYNELVKFIPDELWPSLIPK